MFPKPDVLYETGEAEPLLAEATAAWPSRDEPLPEEISELCRFAFIRASETGRRAESQLWRARAMTSAMLSDAREETTTIRDSAMKAGYGDIARWATLNHEVMTRGEFVGWSPYEVL